MYGASIERGIITEACSGGAYRVASCTRDGVATPALPCLDNAGYAVGDRVFYFMFPDGQGLILARFG